MGFSFVRLMPKETGARVITNLRRRAIKNDVKGRGGSKGLGQSINQILAPLFSIINFEKVCKTWTVIDGRIVYRRDWGMHCSRLQICMPDFAITRLCESIAVGPCILQTRSSH